MEPRIVLDDSCDSSPSQYVLWFFSSESAPYDFLRKRMKREVPAFSPWSLMTGHGNGIKLHHDKNFIYHCYCKVVDQETL